MVFFIQLDEELALENVLTKSELPNIGYNNAQCNRD